jgi:hypothetical protein
MMHKHFFQIALLVCAVVASAMAPAKAADTVYQRTPAGGAIELSNLDSDDATQEVLVAPPAPGNAAKAAAALEPANLAAQDAAADASGFAARPERAAALAAVKERVGVALPAPQQYRELMLQQASFNGGANGNQYSARKYLKLSRDSYLSGLGN